MPVERAGGLPRVQARRDPRANRAGRLARISGAALGDAIFPRILAGGADGAQRSPARSLPAAASDLGGGLAPETKTRYQRAFAEAAEKIAPVADDLDTLFLRFRLANARRELGEFDAARAALDSLPLAALDVTAPTGEEVAYEQRRDAESRRFLFETIR